MYGVSNNLFFFDFETYTQLNKMFIQINLFRGDIACDIQDNQKTVGYDIAQRASYTGVM